MSIGNLDKATEIYRTEQIQAANEAYRAAYGFEAGSLSENQINHIVLHSRVVPYTNQIEGTIADRFAEQISAQVALYNAQSTKSTNPNEHEMLPKSPDDILSNFRNDESCIIVGLLDDKLIVLAHAATYELLNRAQAAFLRTQLIEYGTEITDPAFRNHGLGKSLVIQRIKKVQNLYGSDTAGILTIKHYRTGGYWRSATHEKARAISWYDHPYVSFLTDSCAGVRPTESESGHCNLRRSHSESDQESLKNATHIRGATMSCTMLGVNPQCIQNFEGTMRETHQRLIETGTLTGMSIHPGPQSVSRDAFNHIDAFYTYLSNAQN
jgi:hypothetical protein